MIMKNGTVLPSGLYSVDNKMAAGVFNKKFNNFPIRVGVVTKRINPTDKRSVSKIFVEYDVLVNEVVENSQPTPLTYRNCVAIDSFGGIADYLQATYREQKQVDNDSLPYLPSTQNGSYVLIACLDGQSTSAVILGGLQNPNRKKKLTEGNNLLAAFNGLEMKINRDGSFLMTFNGETDNYGQVINSKIKPTSVGIGADGAISMSNGNFVVTLSATGKFSVTLKDGVAISAEKDISVASKQNVTVSAEQKVSVTSKSDMVIQAQGSATFGAQSLKLNSDGDLAIKTQTMSVQSQTLSVRASQITLQGMTFVGGPGGLPALNLSTQMIGISAMGPVVSSPVGPFATQTFVL